MLGNIYYTIWVAFKEGEESQLLWSMISLNKMCYQSSDCMLGSLPLAHMVSMQKQRAGKIIKYIMPLKSQIARLPAVDTKVSLFCACKDST